MAAGYERGHGKLGIARLFALVLGIAYLGMAIMELFYPESDPLSLGDTVVLQRTVLQNVVHFAVGIVVLGSFFAGESAARTVARVIGVVFLALAVYGFVAPDSLGEALGYGGDIPAVYNFVHAATAILALFAGFAGRRSTAVA
jgi:hypothetical protein